MALLIALLAAVAVGLLLLPAPAATWEPPRSPVTWLAHRLADHLATTRLARDLTVSGLDTTMDQLAARKLRLAGLALAGWALLSLMDSASLSLVALGAAVWAYRGPDLEIARLAQARRIAVQRDLPSFLFTMAVLTEAGLQLLPALDHYCRQARSTLATELKAALAAIQLGQSPALAFLNLAQQLDVRDFTLFVSALVQTMEKGTDGLSATLRAQAETAWEKRRRLAQELGAKASIKLFMPLLLFVLPAILAIAAGPALYSFATQFLR